MLTSEKGIFQDNKKDWEIAAASMANIYENATITIAATCCSNSDQGCFSRTLEEMIAKPILDTGLFVRREKSPFPTFWNTGDKEMWPLLRRAWVFQERKLSPRVVHLAQEQLYWECETCFVSEDGIHQSYTDDVLDHSIKNPQQDPTEAWRMAVQHYSKLDLTYESDRLPAISALVERMQQLRKGDVYVAGMWVDSLLEDLAWYVVNRRPQPRPTEKYPTWSWASVRKGVALSAWSPLQSVQLINACYKIIGPSHIGRTENASITVKAPFLNVELTTYDGSDDYFIQECFNVVHNTGSSRNSISFDRLVVDFDYRTADPPILSGEKFVLLLLARSPTYRMLGGIVLRSTEQEVYERVGFLNHVRPPRPFIKFVDSLPIKQFKIV